MTDGSGTEPDDLWTAGPSTSEPRRRQPAAPERTVPVLWCLVAVGVAALLGIGAGHALGEKGGTDERVTSGSPGDRSSASPVTSAPSASAPTTAASAPDLSTAPPTTAAPVPPTTLAPPVPGSRDWGAVAQALAPMQLPSDCTLPLGVPESLPNAARDYRGGVHEGIDFICGVRGREAVAAMDGQIVMANNSYEEPTPGERLEVLGVAKSLGRTPPWTLAMLFGRFVVIDHGVVDGAGHVTTIYAHLDQIDPSILPGHHVAAGDRLGEIGNRGTETAGTGVTRPQSIHLHWEIHVDDAFLGAGASSAETDALYMTLFGR